MRSVVFPTLMAAGVLAACSREPEVPAQPRTVQPADFALEDCGVTGSSEICVIVYAGGKTLLINAPAGISGSVSPEKLAGLDAVLLTGMSWRETEGLDEVRNQGWIAGRSAPLQVSGPSGVDLLARGLNGAFQTADAVAQVEDNPPGGFSAALINGQEGEGRAPWIAFDTGDLRALALPDNGLQLAYQITYETFTVLVRPCDWTGVAEVEFSVQLTCAEQAGDGDVIWPMPEGLMFLKTTTEG